MPHGVVLRSDFKGAILKWRLGASRTRRGVPSTYHFSRVRFDNSYTRHLTGKNKDADATTAVKASCKAGEEARTDSQEDRNCRRRFAERNPGFSRENDKNGFSSARGASVTAYRKRCCHSKVIHRTTWKGCCAIPKEGRSYQHCPSC